jgi:hypothetical protein
MGTESFEDIIAWPKPKLFIIKHIACLDVFRPDKNLMTYCLLPLAFYPY